MADSVTKRASKKKTFTWEVEEEFHNFENGTDGTDKIEETKAVALKRGKRTLNSEKLGPRSVKVLRRSHTQTSSEIASKPSPKVRLPLVKINGKSP